MGNPQKHIPVKLIVGLISSKPAQFAVAAHIFEKKFGKIDRETPFLDFSSTAYYNEELGNNLKRKFFSFEKLLPLKRSYKIKLYTNKIEERLSENKGAGQNRTVNIDPGYITLANLVLFTTKNRSHRIYLENGIYADLELTFSRGAFRPLDWTYPDYRTNEYIDFFNTAREMYLGQIRNGY